MKDRLDFIVIGAQKAGTTSLFEYVREHPEISAPAAKEAWYFIGDARIADGWEPYLEKHFGLQDPKTKWGTFTPQYMWGGIPGANDGSTTGIGDLHLVPERIRAQLPDVRLIAILRDPVQRALSHHAMAVMNRIDSRSPAQALRECLRSEALTAARETPSDWTGYITFGEYGRVLSGYYDTFASEQILVLYLDDLQRDPGGVVQSIFEFLGLTDTGFVPSRLGTVYRPGARKRRLAVLDRHRLERAAEITLGLPLIRQAWSRVPKARRIRASQMFDGMTYRLDLWNRDPTVANGTPLLDGDLRDALDDHYRSDGALLAKLTGTRPSWIT